MPHQSTLISNFLLNLIPISLLKQYFPLHDIQCVISYQKPLNLSKKPSVASTCLTHSLMFCNVESN